MKLAAISQSRIPMALRINSRLHYPCDRCSTKFERFGRSRICQKCLNKAQKLGTLKTKNTFKLKGGKIKNV